MLFLEECRCKSDPILGQCLDAHCAECTDKWSSHKVASKLAHLARALLLAARRQLLMMSRLQLAS